MFKRTSANVCKHMLKKLVLQVERWLKKKKHREVCKQESSG